MSAPTECMLTQLTKPCGGLLVGRRLRRIDLVNLDIILASTKLKLALILICCLGLLDCHSQKSDANPTIEFTKIPPAAQGGREKVDSIAGRVMGYRPGQQIVIYAHSGPWWVQPWPDQALIPIQADSTWSTSTHLGFDYAALLVEPQYRPPLTIDVAPTQGGSVVSLRLLMALETRDLPPLNRFNLAGT